MGDKTGERLVDTSSGDVFGVLNGVSIDKVGEWHSDSHDGFINNDIFDEI
jgi:hypothetical protein